MMQPIQQPFKGFPQIADQMPPIEDLLGLGRAQRGTTRILCRTVTAQDDDARMVVSQIEVLVNQIAVLGTSHSQSGQSSGIGS